MWYRIWTIFVARTKEFYRDRTALGWNIVFPLLIIIGFSIIFKSESNSLFKVGIITDGKLDKSAYSEHLKEFLSLKYIDFIHFESKEIAISNLQKYKLDMVIDNNGNYYVNDSSPHGYIVEQLLHGAGSTRKYFSKYMFKEKGISYVEWLFPGILGMNAMFNSLYGVGYVLVMYRKHGILKRFSVTPVRPFEFLTAQILSRMFVMLATTAIVYIGTVMLYGFTCKGSLLTLLVVFVVGGFCMISLGLLIASRGESLEFADGLINVITWPMMLLSEVWFSLEGAQPWIKKVSQLLPLTPIVDSARKVMHEGASLYDIKFQIIYLVFISVIFLIVGSLLFRWNRK